MAANDVLILRVDTSTSNSECLCTGENRAAARQRKTKTSTVRTGVGCPLADVLIVDVEPAKPKKARCRESKRVSSHTDGEVHTFYYKENWSSLKTL